MCQVEFWHELLALLRRHWKPSTGEHRFFTNQAAGRLQGCGEMDCHSCCHSFRLESPMVYVIASSHQNLVYNNPQHVFSHSVDHISFDKHTRHIGVQAVGE